MKFYKIWMFIIALVMSLVIVIIEPVLHKPFVFEKQDFKLAKSYQEPAAMQTLRLLRLGDAPVETSNVVVKPQENNQQAKHSIHIEPSEFYQIANREKVKPERVVQAPPPPVQEQKQIEPPPVVSEPEEEIEEEPVDNSFRGKMLQRREETIAWNKWRSDLQNAIMMDSSVSAPLGTIFFFSFKVNNKGHISNIKVLCSNPVYQKEALSIIPVIKAYEGHNLLKFPKKTKRKSVKFDGTFIIWIDTQFSSPDNFSDFERIHYYE